MRKNSNKKNRKKQEEQEQGEKKLLEANGNAIEVPGTLQGKHIDLELYIYLTSFQGLCPSKDKPYLPKTLYCSFCSSWKYLLLGKTLLASKGTAILAKAHKMSSSR